LNTFFTWPKMLAVGFLLLVFALLFCRRPEDDRERAPFGVLIGGLAALAVLSHGGSVIALLGFAVGVIVFWARPPLQTMIYGLAACCCRSSRPTSGRSATPRCACLLRLSRRLRSSCC
jgi:hypothetical protein